MDYFTTFCLLILLPISLPYALGDPVCGSGDCQSPIDFETAAENIHRLPIHFKHYNQRLPNVTVANTGHTVTVTGNWGEKIPTVTGKFVNNSEYGLYAVHFHWGETDDTGSEHTINLTRYASEVHLVHYNCKYDSYANALNKSDGLLVVGLLFEVCNTTAPNEGLKMLAELSSTVEELDSTSTGRFDLEFFGIEKLKSWFTYAGSLTTSPYSENVQWVVSAKVLPTTEEIMEVLRAITLEEHEEANARSVQPLNGRHVVHYYQ